MAKILIADDDAMLIKLLEFKLRGNGYQVLHAADGESALALARSETPDLIVLDAMMPGLDGFSVLRRLKEDPAYADIPVMMLTARRREQDVVEGLKLGAAEYLVKPFMPDELMTRIGVLLGRTARRR